MFEADRYEHENFSGMEADFAELRKKTFVECSFNGADFTEVSAFCGCTFDRCDFSSARLNGVELRDCAFLSCSFRYAGFFATVFRDCKMTGSSLTEADCSLLSIDGGSWCYTELRYLELDKQELRGIDFTGADLTGARLTRCTIEACTFQDVQADKLSFRDSDLRTSSLGNLDLLAVDLKNTRVDLEQCVLIAEALGARYVP